MRIIIRDGQVIDVTDDPEELAYVARAKAEHDARKAAEANRQQASLPEPAIPATTIAALRSEIAELRAFIKAEFGLGE